MCPVMLTFTVEDLDLITGAKSVGELYTQVELLLISFSFSQCMRNRIILNSAHTGFFAVPVFTVTPDSMRHSDPWGHRRNGGHL